MTNKVLIVDDVRDVGCALHCAGVKCCFRAHQKQQTHQCCSSYLNSYRYVLAKTYEEALLLIDDQYALWIFDCDLGQDKTCEDLLDEIIKTNRPVPPDMLVCSSDQEARVRMLNKFYAYLGKKGNK